MQPGVSAAFVTCADSAVLTMMGMLAEDAVSQGLVESHVSLAERLLVELVVRMAVSKDLAESQVSLAGGLLVELVYYLYYLVYQQLVFLQWL